MLFQVLGLRIGYLPLLVPLIKPHFSSTLPPGTDIVWFDYKGLPLKWYVMSITYFPRYLMLIAKEIVFPWKM